jgi:hypothetical protein
LFRLGYAGRGRCVLRRSAYRERRHEQGR